MTICPLCMAKESFAAIPGPFNRDYLLCNKCKLIFTDTRIKASRQDEEKRYKDQEKGLKSKTYRDRLGQVLNPVLPFLAKKMAGLNYYSGPAPVLSELLEQSEIQCDNYDPEFFPDMPGEKGYDFVFCIDCLERFFLPASELQRLNGLLKPGALLIIMTAKWPSIEKFKSWRHAKDSTRVSFYRPESIRTIAAKFNYTVIPSANPELSILYKN